MDEKKQEKRNELFRNTSIGVALETELDKHFSEQQLTQDECEKISSTFDEVMAKHLAKFEQQNSKIQYRLQGDLQTYRYFDSTWEFECTNFEALPVQPPSNITKQSNRIYIRAVEGNNRPTPASARSK